jgi:hypothetical protein
MISKKFLPFLVAALLVVSLACAIGTPAPNQADPNAFNTMVAQTALARPTIPPAVTAPPTAIPPTSIPTITSTQGPSVLVNVTVNLPRHTALDLETKAISAPLADMGRIAQNLPDLSGYYKKAPPGSDLVFWAENPNYPEMQFLYPINGTRVAVLRSEPLLKANHKDCVRAFTGEGLVFPHPENDAFPLDYSVFVSEPGRYYCFTTDRGNLGAFKLTPPGDYIGMAYVIMEYILWDAKIP